MKDLTVRVVYTPNRKAVEQKKECRDNTVHIRFRDYDKPMIISGFNAKLTYVLTYLFNLNYQISLTDAQEKDFSAFWRKHINRFLDEDPEARFVLHYTAEVEVQAYPNYRKKGYDSPTRQFGSLAKGTYPEDTFYSIDSLITGLNLISLDEFLTNDKYELVIEENERVDKKYQNKVKKYKVKKKEIVESNLW